MKRPREEEGAAAEHEQEEEAPPAPMAEDPPAPMAAPASLPAPSRAQQALTRGDTMNFMLSVRDTFGPAKYQEFLRVVRQVDSYGLSGLVDRMRVLLHGQPDLVRQFNMFLPEGYEINLMDIDNKHEEAPVADHAQKD